MSFTDISIRFLEYFSEKSSKSCEYEGKIVYCLLQDSIDTIQKVQANWIKPEINSSELVEAIIKIKKILHISTEVLNSSNEMQKLIENAHIHCLYTYQCTGLKLKLLNVLFSGRFVFANEAMLTGTSLSQSCYITNTPDEYIHQIKTIFSKEFTLSDFEARKRSVVSMENHTKTATLLKLLNL